MKYDVGLRKVKPLHIFFGNYILLAPEKDIFIKIATLQLLSMRIA